MIKRSLKIMMLAPTPFFADRGCHVRIFEETRAIAAAGHQVEIVTYHLGKDMQGIVTHRTPRIPWYGKLDAGPSWHKPYLDILLFFKALAVAKQFKPDLIHAHLHEGAFVGIFLKKLLGIPLLFDCQGSLTGEIVDHGFIGRGSFAAAMFGWLEGIINKSADAIITSSSPAADDLMQTWGVPLSKVTAVTDGVNTEEFSPADGAAIRRELGISSDIPVVAFLGVFNRYQGVDLLLDVVKIMKERGSQVHFLLMGFPDEKYRKLAADMGLEQLITFTGKIDYAKAPQYLAAADIAVSPKLSLTEANGKLFNYMACGLPSLVFDTPVNREILDDTGIFADFGNAIDFADKLEKLLSDSELCKRSGKLSRKRAVEEHSWRSRSDRLSLIYASLVAKRF